MSGAGTAAGGCVGEVADGLTLRGWAVDPSAGREGACEVVVSDGVLERVTWLAGADADGIGADGTLIAPGFIDLHAHVREPGNEDAETVATGVAAAAHGGFTTICVMPNTTPATDDPGIVARVRAAAARSGSPVRVLVHGAVTAGRRVDRPAAQRQPVRDLAHAPARRRPRAAHAPGSGRAEARAPASRYSRAIRTATPFVTCSVMTDRGSTATSAAISTPSFMGPGCMTTTSGDAARSRSRVSP